MRKGRAKRKNRNPRSVPPKASRLAAEPQVVVGTSTRREVPETDVARTEPSPRLAESASKLLEQIETPIEAIAVAAPMKEEPSSLEAVVTEAKVDDKPLVPEEPVDSEKAVAAPDEISIPPAGDLAVDEKFFSEGDLAHHTQGAHMHDDDWEDDKPSSRKHEPHVVQRRERFARYVKLAVAGASVLCLAAIGRSALTTSRSASVDTKPVAVAVAKEAPAPVAEPTPAPAAAPAPAPAKVEEPKPAEPAAVAKPEEAKPAETAAAKADEPAKAADDKPAEAVDAKAEKSASRKALERGKLDDAIAAGERSVAADAEDGEAWLILGAAYQEKGKLADARRCYTACVKQGKRGPIGECSAMLR